MIRNICFTSILGSVIAFGLVACGGGSQKDLPLDDPLERTMDVGKEAVYYHRLQQAETQYKLAFDYALRRNDASEIDDAGYNLAVVQLGLDQLSKTQATIQQTRNELYVRNQANSYQLDLVEAGLFFRQNQLSRSATLAMNAQQSDQEDIQERAYFLSGLIADRMRNTDQLQIYLQKLDDLIQKSKHDTSDTWKADQAELQARLAFQSGQFAQTLVNADKAENIRRNEIEYRSMARVIALKAQAEQALGNNRAAAAYYLQAGQSAALLKDKYQARLWLNQAMSPSADQITYNLAFSQLKKLEHEDKKSKSNAQH